MTETKIESSDSIYGRAELFDTTPEAPFLGASTFMRRPYRRDLRDVDIAVLGVTFDIDDLDPAYAPATGTPVPSGLTSNRLLEILCGLDNIDFIGMDVV